MVTHVVLLGSPAIERGDEWHEPVAGKLAAILYYVACQPGWVSRDDLLYLLYPDTEERKARQNLRPLLSKLRRERYAEGLEVERTRLRWDVPTDLRAFRNALAANHLVRADRLYTGDLLTGFRLPAAPEFETWLELERSELREAWRGALLALAAALEAEDRHLEEAELLERLHAADSFDEAVVRRRLMALARAKGRSEALRFFESFEAELEREVEGEPEDATRELVDELRAGRFDRASVGVPTRSRATARRTRHGLPVPTTPFIGREREIADISERLRNPACRLLTVVAPGGMGKTRLAIELARRLATDFADDARFAALEAVRAPEQAVSSLADAFSLVFSGAGDPRRQLLEHLASQETLLVLDNFEHLLDDPAGPELVTELLEQAPGVTLLCTSRERLNLRAEWVYDLDGMALPHHGNVRAADAGALFLQAAARVRADAALDDAGGIVRICRLLQGMPLALELAASWLRVLGVEEIARELEAGTDLLEARLRDLPPRHHSLRAVLDASWRRLSEREQGAALQLTVFYEGFHREAARDVAEVGLPLLLALANKSFLRRDASGRFTQHPLMWQYLRGMAEQDDAFAQTEERHARYFAAFLNEREAGLQGLDARTVRNEINDELANVRAAWSWATWRGRADLLDQAAEGLYLYHHEHGRYYESEALFATAVEAVASGSFTAGRLLCFLGGCYNYLADSERAFRVLEAALPILERSSLKREAGMSLHFLFSRHSFNNRPAHEVAPLLRRAMRLFREAGDLAHEAEATGLLAEYTEDPFAAEAEFRESLRLFRASGRCFAVLGGVTLALSNYGVFTMQVHGAYRKASGLFDEAVRIARARGEPYGVAWYLNNQAELLIYQGELEEARRRFSEAREAGEAVEAGWGMWTSVHALYGLGWLARMRGEIGDAKRFLIRARDQIATHGDPLGTGAEIQLALGKVLLAEGRPGEAAELCRAALRHFASLNLQQAVRQWGEARCLLQLGEIALAEGDQREAAAHFVQALAVVQRWHLFPLALHLAVATASFLRSEGEEEWRGRLLELAAGSSASTFETKTNAIRELGTSSRRVRAAGTEVSTSCGALLEDLRLVVRAMG